MVFNFSWKRDSTEILLTTYNGGVQYARPKLYSLDYEASISKQANNALVYLNEWMKQNLDKNPVLAQCIRVIPQPDYVTNTPSSDTVFHAERPLVWSDFPERKTATVASHHSANVRFAASIFSNFLYEAPARMKNGCIEIDFRVKVFMQKSMSWVLPTAKDTYSLNHEQTHFNITRLVAERFKSHILGQDLSVDYYDSQMQLAFLDFYRDMTNLQKQYDEETQHGINTTAQAQWEQKIEKALAVFN